MGARLNLPLQTFDCNRNYYARKVCRGTFNRKGALYLFCFLSSDDILVINFWQKLEDKNKPQMKFTDGKNKMIDFYFRSSFAQIFIASLRI